MNWHWSLLMILYLIVSGTAAAAESALFLAPRQPVAGEPWSIVLPASVLGGIDLDPTTSPTAEIDGSTIIVRTNAECGLPSCDTISTSYFRVDVPPVPAGSYTVIIDPFPFPTNRPTYAISVVEAPAVVQHRHVDGFWYDPSRPGSGLFLSRQGGVTAIAVLSSEPAGETFEPVWLIDAVRVFRNTAVAAMRRPASQPLIDPNCLTCASTTEPLLRLSSLPVLIEFQAERRARVESLDGTSFNLVALAFGGYLDLSFADTIAGETVELALPDVAGRWVVDDPDGPLNVEFGSAQFGDDRVSFTSTVGTLICPLERPGERARCDFGSDADVRVAGLTAWVGNMSPRRMLFQVQGGQHGAERQVLALRME